MDYNVDASIWWNGSWIIGGNFTQVGGIDARGVARWDGSSWSAMTAGLHPAAFGFIGVHAFTVWNGSLIAAGNFYVEDGATCNLARWNGTSWVRWGSGVGASDETVYSLAAYGGQLYAGGMFSGHIRRMSDGTAPGGGTDDDVRSLSFFNGLLIAGGAFHNAGGVPVAHIAQWDGTSWAPLGPGVDGPGLAWVAALAVASPTELYVGGGFTQAGEVAAANIARWDGSSWSGLGAGTSGTVRALAAQADGILVGGHFLSADGVLVNHVARHTEAGWSPIGDGVPFVTYALSTGLGDVVAGGPHAVSRWDGTQWLPLENTASVGNEPGKRPVLQVVPNPSRGEVRIGFVPVTGGFVQMAIFDASGHVVCSRVETVSSGRPHEVVWDGTGASGLPVPAGSYWVRLSGGSGNSTSRLIVVR